MLAYAALPEASLAQIDDLVHQKVSYTYVTSPDAGKSETQVISTIAAAGAYNGVVLSGSATQEFSRGYIRFQSNIGWTTWYPLQYLSTSTNELFLAGFRSETYRSDNPFELRFDGPGVITLHDVGVFDNRLDEDRMPAEGGKRGASLQSSSISALQAPRLIPRGEWGAEAFTGGEPIPLARPSYDRMTFHHAACCSASTYEQGIAQVKAIQDFHQDVRGWSDIGYHFVFDQSGRLYQGRPFLDDRTNLAQPPVLAQGAHVGGNNRGNIGVALLGCYHPPEGSGCVDQMSPALRDSVVAFYAFLSDEYGVSTDNLFGHRDQTATSCPGDNNYAQLPALRLDINDFVRTGGLPRPESFFIAENFPNPFLNSTTIRYFLEHEGFVRIKVYDPVGRLVTTLVDSYQEEDRWYTVEFTTDELGSGTYFYRIQVEGFAGIAYDETRPMVRFNYQTPE